MIYKNKLIFLCTLIGVLSLLYVGSFVFSPERMNRRSSSYVWIDEKQIGSISRIVINSESQNIEFIKQNNTWTAVSNNIEYPARTQRIEDFIKLFSMRGVWSVRSSSASTHASFGLDSEEADRVTFFAGTNVIMDVLIGHDSAFGNEVAIRRFANNEVRSGDNRIKTYILGSAVSWLNLRLFQEDGGQLGLDDVQSLTVFNEGEMQVFGRSNRTWLLTSNIAGEVTNIENISIENYIRTILNIEGDDFIISLEEDSFIDVSASIIFEFGNGNIVTANFSEPNEQGSRFAQVSGKTHIYSVPGWAARTLFRSTESFISQQGKN